MGEFVPDLREKIDLLARKGYGSRKDLAAELKINIGTLNGWINGSLKSKPSSLPETRIHDLARLLVAALHDRVSMEAAQRLLRGRLESMEAAFSSTAPVLLEDLIKSEATRGRIVIRRRSTLGLVEHDRDDDDPEAPTLLLGERFMLECSTEREGFVAFLQNAQQLWGIVTFADGQASCWQRPGPVLVPGIRDARLVWTREETQIGPHRFLCIVCPEPFPLSLANAARSKKALESDELGEIASHYDTQARELREMHLLDVVVTKR